MFFKNQTGTDLIEKVLFLVAVAAITILVFTGIGNSSQTSADGIAAGADPNQIPVFPVTP